MFHIEEMKTPQNKTWSNILQIINCEYLSVVDRSGGEKFYFIDQEEIWRFL